MSNILDVVNLRTQMVGQNRLELLLFHLQGRQRYGINVFKVQEVIRRPSLTRIPKSHPAICGVAIMRGKTIPVIDTSMAMGLRPFTEETAGNVIITEYNRSVQGFLVRAVDRIINMKWEEVMAPPVGAGGKSYLTAVTRVDNEIVEIIDVEKVLSQIDNLPSEVSASIVEGAKVRARHDQLVLVVDDSSVARNQVKRTLDQLEMESIVCNNGREALDLLLQWVSEDNPMLARLSMVISDVEMPEMDGYTLTSEIKKHERLKKLYVLLHTSLSGVFNQALVKQVGADRFVPKFDPDDLANAIVERIAQMNDQKEAA